MTPSIPRVVAICGRRRAGKDTIAEYLVRHHGYVLCKIAAPLKEATCALFGMQSEQLECDKKDEVDERWGITPRQALQFLGTDVMQFKLPELLPGIGRSFWIQSFIHRNMQPGHPPLVVSDMRFIHEYEELKKQTDVFVIRVDRPLRGARMHDRMDEHPSETECERIPYHLFVHNTGSRDDLWASMRSSLEFCGFVSKVNGTHSK
jgi:hypothetical protein